MNANTKEAMLGFIDAVETLAFSVSSVCGTDSINQLFDSAEKLRHSLKTDETILE